MQRFGRIKVESTSFTISEPHELLEIEPMIYELADRNQKEILAKSYNVAPFNIDTIKLERIFMDKVFAVEYFYQRKQFADAAKHLYDLIILLKNDKIIKLLKDLKQLKAVLTLTREEQNCRYGKNIFANLTISKFSYLNDNLFADRTFLDAFLSMQKIYILNQGDNIDPEICLLPIIKKVVSITKQP